MTGSGEARPPEPFLTRVRPPTPRGCNFSAGQGYSQQLEHACQRSRLPRDAPCFLVPRQPVVEISELLNPFVGQSPHRSTMS